MKSNIGPGGWITIVAIMGIVLLGVVALLTVSEAEGAPSEQSCSNPVYVTVMYEVKKGDTWSKVARRYKISVARLKAMNPDVVFVRGAVLKAPILISCQDRPTPTPFPVQAWPRG